MKVNNNDKWWIRELRGHGFSIAEIANMLSISPQQVAKTLQMLKLQLVKKYPFLEPEDDQ